MRLAKTAPMPSSIVRSAPPQKASLPEVTTTPLMAVSAATLSTSAPNSSITPVLMTFMERPAMSQVTSAIPSASTSILKFAIADSCSPAHDHFETGPTFRCSCLKRFAIFPRVTCAFFVTHHHHIDLGIMRTLGRGTRTDFDKDRITIRTIDQTVSDGNSRLPGGRIPRLEHDVASILPQHHLSLEHVDEFVLALMPVALRGRGARLERADVDAELREACGAGKPLAAAPFHGLVEGGRISRRGADRNFIDVDFRHVRRVR